MNKSIEFLTSLSKLINDKSDYNVNYKGDRKYIGGGKILNLPILFAFGCNVNKRKIVISLETSKSEGSKIIKDFYISKKEEISKLNYNVVLSKGVKNKEWTRLELVIDISNENDLLSYSDECFDLFMKYKLIVEDYLNNKTSTWIFQGNPKYEQDFDFNKDLVQDGTVIWSIKKEFNLDKVKLNDEVFIWRSDGNNKGSGGIVAYGNIVTKPYKENETYVVDLKVKDVRLTEEDGMLKRIDIKEDSLLSNMLIIKQPNGTNYKLEDYEAKYLKDIWNNKKQYNSNPRYWAISLGEDGQFFDECKYDEEILIGWDYLGDLENYNTKEEISEAIKNNLDNDKNPTNDILAVYQFLREMRVGDVVIAKKGKSKILGYGKVISDYLYYNDKDIFKHSRKIKWQKLGEWILDNKYNLPIKTLTDISNYTDIKDEIFCCIENEKDTGKNLITPIIREHSFDEDNTIKDIVQYSKQDILKEVFLEEDKIDDIILNMDYKQNIILQGPPGVGKTFVAKKLCYLHQKYKTENIEIVQFHQSYSYEDFISGYRPNKNGGFELKKGIFYKFVEQAIENPKENYYFIIDEINRGNLSKIFGELMMLIEKDKRGKEHRVSLTYQEEYEKFYIPKNLYIIGTMNTADRSIAMVDYALRRRFAFIDIEPAFDNKSLKDYFNNHLGNEMTDKIINKINILNKIIEKESIDLGKGYRIGHSYFTPTQNIDDIDRWYRNIIKMEIEPLIREYWFDESEEELQKKVDDLLDN